MDLLTNTKGRNIIRYPVLVYQNNSAQWLTIRLAIKQCFPEIEPILMSTQVTALAYLSTVSILPSALPRLIFIDLSIPAPEDGLDFLATLKSDPRFAKIPVIMLGDSEVPQDVLRVYTSGAAGYVFKPINYADWITCFSKNKAYWRELAKLPLST